MWHSLKCRTLGSCSILGLSLIIDLLYTCSFHIFLHEGISTILSDLSFTCTLVLIFVHSFLHVRVLSSLLLHFLILCYFCHSVYVFTTGITNILYNLKHILLHLTSIQCMWTNLLTYMSYINLSSSNQLLTWYQHVLQYGQTPKPPGILFLLELFS